MIVQLVYEGKPKVKGKVFEGGGQGKKYEKKNIYK
jgi:hypothetical protein